MAKKQDAKTRGAGIDRALTKAYPDAECSLDHKSPLQLLVATILSAQCTDERVNIVTKTLFKKYRSAQAFAEAELAELEADVRSTGFYRNKAKSIRGCCRLLLDEFGGKVPRELDDLLKLPGVARKTANVVRGVAYGLADGVVVDTHVKRLARRLGLTKQNDPNKIERDLMAVIPPKSWIAFSHRMIQHGRAVCAARKPQCGACPLAPLCPSAGQA